MNEHFVLRIPDSLPLEEAALMLCAASGLDHVAIRVWSLRRPQLALTW